MTIASHGQPSRKHPSGPLLMHFLQPIHRMGSTWIRPNGGWSSSGTQNMQSSTGQYSTQAGDPAQPVQHSVITANSFGFFLRGVLIPVVLGSNLSSSGTIPTAFPSADMARIIALALGSTAFRPCRSRVPKVEPGEGARFGESRPTGGNTESRFLSSRTGFVRRLWSQGWACRLQFGSFVLPPPVLIYWALGPSSPPEFAPWRTPAFGRALT